MVQTVKLKESIERLLSREDVILSQEQINQYLNDGQWTKDTFVDYLEHNAKTFPNRAAIIEENGKMVTYAQFHERTNQIALALLELGLSPEDRIAIQLPNWSELVLSFMGAAKARILPIMCHLPYTEHDLDYVFELAEPKAIIIADEFKGRNFLELAEKMKEKHPCLEHIIVVSEKHYEGTINFFDLLQKKTALDVNILNEVRPVGTDPFFIIFTSGTTGRPKAVFHLHANNLFWVKQVNGDIPFDKDGNWLLGTPIAHLTALGMGVLNALYRGTGLIMMTSWDVKKAIELIEREKPTYFLGVATMLIDLARFENLEEREVRSIKAAFYAGAPCPINILKILNKRIGCNVGSFYGYSEAGITHCTRLVEDLALTSTSFGKALDGIEQKIVDESGEVLQTPCEGEIVVKAPNFIPGYYRQPERNKQMFDKEGWFHSADVVRLHEDGYGIFVSRKDELIIRGGYKIDPREIEEVLYTHPLIKQALVIGMPDERLGERINAFIILNDSQNNLSLKEVTDFLEEKGIAKNHWPELIKIVESFPMTSSGKVQRFALREQAKKIEKSN